MAVLPGTGDLGPQVSSGLAVAAVACKVSCSVGWVHHFYFSEPKNGLKNSHRATIIGEEDLQNLRILKIAVLVSALSQFSKLSKYTQENMQTAE